MAGIDILRFVAPSLTELNASLSDYSRLPPFQRSMRAFVVSLLSLHLLACSSSPTIPVFGPDLTSQEQTRQLQNAMALQHQAQSLFDQGRYLEAISPAKEAVAIREQILEPTHPDVATALTTLGLIHGTLIELPRATALLERALELRRSNLGPDHSIVGESLTNLGSVQYAGGDFVRAIQTLEQSLPIHERALGPSDPDVAVTLTHLAIALRGMSRLEEARARAERAISILRTTHPPRPRDLAMAINVAGNILARQGNFEQARSLLEESLHRYEEASGSHHPDVGGALVQMAMLESKQRNFEAALALLKPALAITERSYGKDNPEVAGILHEIGLAQLGLDTPGAAEQQFRRELEIQERKLDPTHPFIASTLVELAEITEQQGDTDGARDLLQRALRIQEQSLGRDHTSTARTLTSLGLIEARASNLSLAETYFARALQIRETALGRNHRDVAASLLELARVKHAQSHLRAARQLYEGARHILQSQQGLNPGLNDETLSRIWKKDLKGFQDYALLLATLAGHTSPDQDSQSAITDGFLVTQQARGWLMQATVAKVLAQHAVGDPSVATLAKRVDELNRKRQGLWTHLNELYGLTDDQRPAEELTRVKQQLSEVQEELNLSHAELQTTAPRYAEVAQPEALNIQGVQRLLRTNEALVSFYALADRVQIWVVLPSQKIHYHESIIDRDELDRMVKQVRASVAPQDRPGSAALVPAAFDVDNASRLYEVLFGSIASHLSGINNLIIIPDEALLPLPFAALVTERGGQTYASLSQLYHQQRTPSPQELVWYASLPWLAKQSPITILPSPSALKLIRQARTPLQKQKEAFLGFGDPALRGRVNQRGGAMMASRGTDVDLNSLHELGRLPGTREELLEVASVLGVKAETNLFLGDRATEPEVRRLNETGRLGQARVIAFATHGLLAGEVYGVTQPALVLTPPPVPTHDNDGLLSMEDILTLKLHNTEWVILSACNTAGNNGSGESLTGLARAFFFAGAKALLVSQWSVDDRATKVLMGEIFRRYGAEPSVEPSKALHEGMLALLHRATTTPDQQYLAHPYAWAPFMLVGDGHLSSR